LLTRKLLALTSWASKAAMWSRASIRSGRNERFLSVAEIVEFNRIAGFA
jgi:hypothetical protein